MEFMAVERATGDRLANAITASANTHWQHEVHPRLLNLFPRNSRLPYLRMRFSDAASAYF